MNENDRCNGMPPTMKPRIALIHATPLAVEPIAAAFAAGWPEADPAWASSQAEEAGELLLTVATAVRRYKSEAGISLGSEFKRLLISTHDVQQTLVLEAAGLDILSVTRARELRVGAGIALNGAREIAHYEGVITIGLE